MKSKILFAITAASVPSSTLHQAYPENIQGISQFVVLGQASNRVTRFGLNTLENVYATNDDLIQFRQYLEAEPNYVLRILTLMQVISHDLN